MKRFIPLLLISFLQAATPPNWTKVVNYSGSTMTNAPLTIPKWFHKGDIANFPQPSIGGTAQLTYQTNVKKRWTDATQTCTINSITSGSEPTLNLTCPGRTVREGELLTITNSGAGVIPTGTYAIAGISSYSPLIGYLPLATSTGTSTAGLTITAIDYGSVEFAFITFPYTSVTVTYSGGNVTAGSTQIDFVNNVNPCYLGNQATCDAAAPTQAQILAFNSSSWGIEIDTSANTGTCSGSANARTMIAAGAWRFENKGPLWNEIIVEDLTAAQPAYDFGCKDLVRTMLVATINSSQTSITLADASELVTLGFPTNISVQPLHTCTTSSCTASNNLPEIMKATGTNTTGCLGTNVVCVTRAQSSSTAQAAGYGSSVVLLSAPAGNANSWQERPLLSTKSTAQAQPNGFAAGTTKFNTGAMEAAQQFASSLPYTALLDGQTITLNSFSNQTGGSAIANVNATGAATGGGAWLYITPATSNWVTDLTGTWKSLHPVFDIQQWTPDGTHQWAGVFETAYLYNSWLHKMQDQYYTLTIKTGAALGTIKVNGDKVPHPANTSWSRAFWDGTAPGGFDNPFGTQTGSGVVIDYNLSYLVYAGVLPPLDAGTNHNPNYPLTGTAVTNAINYWCNTNPVLISTAAQTACSGSIANASNWYYTATGQGHVAQGDQGGRPENSEIPAWDQAYLYSMDVSTQTNINNNITLHEITSSASQATMHWPINTLDDSSSNQFITPGSTSPMGRIPTASSHPTIGGDQTQFWIKGCTGNDCPTFVGWTERVPSAAAGGGGRSGDQLQLDAGHQALTSWVYYIVNGDPYTRLSLYQTASLAFRFSTPGTTKNTRNGAAGLIEQNQVRSFAWPMRDLFVAAGLAIDESPEHINFTQEVGYQAEAMEGWMNITSGGYYGPDTNTSSQWYWGQNTERYSQSANPLGSLFPGIAETTSTCFAPCTGPSLGTYPAYGGLWTFAPWQGGFSTLALGSGYIGFNLTQLKNIRNMVGQFSLGFIDEAINFGTGGATTGAISIYYMSIRQGSGHGSICQQGTCAGGPIGPSAALTGSDTTQDPFSTWALAFADLCVDTTAGCNSAVLPAALTRWNQSPNVYESYEGIQYASAAINSDLTISGCQTSGSGTCGLNVWNWLNNNIPNVSNFSQMPQFNYVPQTAGSNTCVITTSSYPNAVLTVSYSIPLLTTGCAAPSCSISAGSIPAWATLTGCTIAGTPSGAVPTTSSFTISVTDANGNPSLATSIRTIGLPSLTIGGQVTLGGQIPKIN